LRFAVSPLAAVDHRLAAEYRPADDPVCITCKTVSSVCAVLFHVRKPVSDDLGREQTPARGRYFYSRRRCRKGYDLLIAKGVLMQFPRLCR
jgi:hypothetical protein